MDPITTLGLILWPYIASEVEKLYSKSHGGSPHIDLKMGFYAILHKIWCGNQWKFLTLETYKHRSSIFRLYKKICTADLFDKLFVVLLRTCIDLGLVNFSWLSMDETILQASIHAYQLKENYCGKNPTDRERCGTKILFICDESSIPLGYLILGANESEVKHIEETIENMCMNCGERYFLFKGVRYMNMDKVYDSAEARDLLYILRYEENIISGGEEKKLKEAAERKASGEKNEEDIIKERNIAEFGELPPEKCRRWTVKRLNSWVQGFHDVRTRRAHKGNHFEGVVLLALSVIIMMKIMKVSKLKLAA